MSPQLALLILADQSGLILCDTHVLLTFLVPLNLQGLNAQLCDLRDGVAQWGGS